MVTVIDPLEARRLLAVDVGLDDGVLSIEAGSGNERIRVTVEGGNLVARVTGHEGLNVRRSFDLDDVDRFVVEAGNGNDAVEISSAGTDRLTGGAGEDLSTP